MSNVTGPLGNGILETEKMIADQIEKRERSSLRAWWRNTGPTAFVRQRSKISAQDHWVGRIRWATVLSSTLNWQRSTWGGWTNSSTRRRFLRYGFAHR